MLITNKLFGSLDFDYLAQTSRSKLINLVICREKGANTFSRALFRADYE